MTGTKPSLPPAKYAGTIRDDLYGDVKVKHDGDKLTVAFGPGFKADLEHWNYDTFPRPAHRPPVSRRVPDVPDRQAGRRTS